MHIPAFKQVLLIRPYAFLPLSTAPFSLELFSKFLLLNNPTFVSSVKQNCHSARAQPPHDNAAETQDNPLWPLTLCVYLLLRIIPVLSVVQCLKIPDVDGKRGFLWKVTSHRVI